MGFNDESNKKEPTLVKVKHAAPVLYSPLKADTTIHLKKSASFMAVVKRVNNRLRKYGNLKYNKKGARIQNSTKVKYITVMGMGVAIKKCLDIAQYFKMEKQLKVEVYTRSIGVMDEFRTISSKESASDDPKKALAQIGETEYSVEDDVEGTSTFVKRNVGCIEVRVFLPENKDVLFPLE